MLEWKLDQKWKYQQKAQESLMMDIVILYTLYFMASQKLFPIIIYFIKKKNLLALSEKHLQQTMSISSKICWDKECFYLFWIKTKVFLAKLKLLLPRRKERTLLFKCKFELKLSAEKSCFRKVEQNSLFEQKCVAEQLGFKCNNLQVRWNLKC